MEIAKKYKYGLLLRMLTMFLPVAFITASCSGNDPDYEPGAHPLPGESQNYVAFSINVPQTSAPTGADNDAPATRSMFEQDENRVETVDLFVFKNNGDFDYHTAARSISAKEGTNDTYTFRAILEEAAGCRLVFIANAADAVSDFLDNNATFTPEQLQKGLIITNTNTTYFTTDKKWNAASPAAAIPMWGEADPVNIVKDLEIKNVKFHRMLARINVLTEQNSNFTLEHVHLFNPAAQGYLIPSSGSWQNEKATNASWDTDPASTWNRTGTTLEYTGYEVLGGNCRNEIYTFEAQAGVNNDISKNTFIIIGGKRAGDTQTQWYRLDIASLTSGNTLKYEPLKRNHTYNFKITKIDRDGAATPQEAIDKGPLNTSHGEGVELVFKNDYNYHYYAYDGDNYLAVEDRTKYISHNEATHQIMVKTDNSTGWQAEVIEGNESNWLKITNPSVTSPGEIPLAFKADLNASDAIRVAVIRITSGDLTTTVTVTQRTSDFALMLQEKDPIVGWGEELKLTVAGGKWNAITVRATDKVTNQQVGITTIPSYTGNDKEVSYDITIAANETWSSRELVFTYSSDGGSTWKNLATRTQLGYEVTVKATDGLTNPLHYTAGIVPQIQCRGYWPDLEFAWFVTTGYDVNTLSKVASGGEVGTGFASRPWDGESWRNICKAQNCPVNDTWNNRYITLRYRDNRSTDENDWKDTDLSYWTQFGLPTPTFTVSPANTIPVEGIQATVKLITEAMPADRIRVRAMIGNTPIGDIDGEHINTVVLNEDVVEFEIDQYLTFSRRTIRFQYRRLNTDGTMWYDNDWITITSRTQGPLHEAVFTYSPTVLPGIGDIVTVKLTTADIPAGLLEVRLRDKTTGEVIQMKGSDANPKPISSASNTVTFDVSEWPYGRIIQVEYWRMQDGPWPAEGRILGDVQQIKNIALLFAKSNVYMKPNGTLSFYTDEDDVNPVPANIQGLHFKWGSLIGLNTNATSDYTDFSSSHVVFVPEGARRSSTWNDIPYLIAKNNGYINDNFIDAYPPTGYYAAAGIGDICRYISDQAGWVEGKWRMPTRAELIELENLANSSYYGYGWTSPPPPWAFQSMQNNTYLGTGTASVNAGVWIGEVPPANDKINPPRGTIFLPASGHRNGIGALYYRPYVSGYGVGGHYWSASGGLYNSEPIGGAFHFVEDLNARTSGTSNLGYSVRCIRDYDPKNY